MKQNKIIFFSLISLLVLMFLFNKLLFGDYKFIGPDALSPAAINQGIEFSKQETGEYPLWMPWVFSGLPSIHSMQNISQFYLPHIFIDFLEKNGLPRIWNYIFHFIFGGIGSFLLLKRFKVDDLSAIFGALSFTFTPYLITMVVHGHGSQMMTSVYIPWVIWAVHRLKTNPKIYNIGILALIVGLQLQRAHVQIAYYTWMLVGLYVLMIMINYIKLAESVNKTKIVIMISLGLLIGLGMSLSIYIPVLEYSNYSIRGSTGGGTGFEYATQWSFSLMEIGSFILPSFVGFGGITYWGQMPFTDYPNYMGILVLIFAIIGALKSNNKEKNIFIWTIFFALLLSLGSNFALFYGIFYDYFPFFNKFRVPVMILILVQFCVSILAGLGLNCLKNNFKFLKINKNLKILGSILFSILFILFLFGEQIIYSFLPSKDLLQRFGMQGQNVINKLRYDNIYNETLFLIIILFLVLLLAYFYKKNQLKWSIIAYSIIVISILDLTIVNHKIIEPTKESYRSSTLSPVISKKRYLKEDDIIKFLQNDTTNYRIFPLGQLGNQNRWSAFNIESIYGYHPAKLNNYNIFMNQIGFEKNNVLQMLNVKYLISLQEIEHPLFNGVFEGKLYHNNKYHNAYIYLFENYIDRAFFVDSLVFSENDEILDYVKNSKKSFTQESFINADLDQYSFDKQRSVDFIKNSPNKIELESRSDNPQFLVLSEIYYPKGWKAYINGNITEIFQVNSVLRGVYLPAGRNNISFVFNPIDVKIGSMLSIISIMLSFLFITSVFYYKKND